MHRLGHYVFLNIMVSRYDDVNSTLTNVGETRFATTFHPEVQIVRANGRKVSDSPASSSEYLSNE